MQKEKMTEKEKLMLDMVTNRMRDLQIPATDEQIVGMADFVLGTILLVQQIQRDLIIANIKDMGNDR